VARVGCDEFAILASMQGSDGAARLATRVECVLADDRSKTTLGWAAYPQEGDNALALYRAASERLYARKVMRSYLRPVPEPVDQAAARPKGPFAFDAV
jgi:GGDEF domain-containing protein